MPFIASGEMNVIQVGGENDSEEVEQNQMTRSQWL